MSDFEQALADARRGHRIAEWEGVATRLAAAAEAEVKRLRQRSARLVDVDLRALKDDYLALQRDYETASAEVEHLKAAWKRADEDANAAHAEVERLKEVAGDFVDEIRDRDERIEALESGVEYEYTFGTEDGFIAGVVYSTPDKAKQALASLKRPHDWHVICRTKAGPWLVGCQR